MYASVIDIYILLLTMGFCKNGILLDSVKLLWTGFRWPCCLRQ